MSYFRCTITIGALLLGVASAGSAGAQGVTGNVPAQLPPTGLPAGIELKPAATTTPYRRVFEKPAVNGVIVDHCETWATNCEGGGAQAFCKQSGSAAAVAWNTYNPGETFVLGSKRVCTGAVCAGYALVVCEK